MICIAVECLCPSTSLIALDVGERMWLAVLRARAPGRDLKLYNGSRSGIMFVLSVRGSKHF